MPFIEEEEPDLFAPVGSFDLPQDPSMLETIGAAFRLENEIVSAATEERGLPTRDPFSIDPNFDPVAAMEEAGRPDIIDNEDVAYANKPSQIQAIIRQSDRELADKQIVQESGAAGFVTTMAAGTLSPINLIPVGGTAYKTYRGGGSILKGAVATGVVGTVSATAQEAALQASQIERSYGESAMNIGGAAFLSGLMGAGATALGKTQFDALAKGVEEDLTIPKTEEVDIVSDPGSIIVPDTVRTPEALKAHLESSELAGAGKNLANLTKNIPNPTKRYGLDFFDNPMTRRMTSNESVDREIFQELAIMPLATKGTQAGEARLNVPVEAQIEIDVAKASNAELFMRDQFQAHRGSKTVALTAASDAVAGTAKKQGKLTFTQFDEQVAIAMRNDDIHDVPEVAAAAKHYREQVIAPATKRMQELGFLPEDLDPKTAQSYLMRKWDTDKLRNPTERAKLSKVISRWLKDRELQQGGARGDLELEAVSQQIIDRIIGGPAGRLPYDVGSGATGTGKATSAPFQERLFLIEDNLVQEFLDNSASDVNNLFAKTVYTDLAFVERFGGEGIDPGDALNMTSQLADIQKAHQTAIDKAIASGASDRKLKKLQLEKEQALEDTKVVRDRIQGKFRISPDSLATKGRKGLGLLRDLNYMRLLGGVVLSSLADLPRVTFKNGVAPFFTEAIPGIIKNPQAFKMAKKDAQLVNRALNVVQSQRLRELAELSDPVRAETKLEKASSIGAQQFGNISLINPWNDIMQSMTSLMVGDSISKAAIAARKGRMTPKQKAQLARIGISEKQARIIGREVEANGTTSGKLKIPNSENWNIKDAETAEALQAYRAALLQEIDTIVINPGQEKQTMLSTEVGKTIFQFKTFGNSSFVKTTLLAAQTPGEAATIASLVGQIGMGMLTFYLKMTLAEKALPDSAEEWLFEGVDRSGVLSFVMDRNATLERVSGNKLGLSPTFGLQGATRYHNVDELATILGPSAALAQSAVSTGVDIAAGEAGKDDARAIRRMMPAQNVFWLRGLFDRAEAKLADVFGDGK